MRKLSSVLGTPNFKNEGQDRTSNRRDKMERKHERTNLFLTLNSRYSSPQKGFPLLDTNLFLGGGGRALELNFDKNDFDGRD